MNRSDNWENERYIYEKLKQENVFKYWKKVQFDCQTGKCAWCKKPMQYRYAETDHIKPLYYGGTSEAHNLVLCHHNCNTRKSTRMNYARPDWIKPNRYDVGVNGRYRTLRAKLENDNNYIGAKRGQVINPKPYSGSSVSSHKSETKQKNSTIRVFFNALYVLVVALIGLLCVFLLLEYIHPATSSNETDAATQNTTNQNGVMQADPDLKNKQLAQSILASYTNYYNNYVNKTGSNMSLPSDQYNCTTWQESGCWLSFYGGAKTPSGYTYSVNSLESKKVFKQNGTIPHASKTNAALYKKARCGDGGNVIGGNEAKNAAVVIQLSDDSYYCVEN